MLVQDAEARKWGSVRGGASAPCQRHRAALQQSGQLRRAPAPAPEGVPSRCRAPRGTRAGDCHMLTAVGGTIDRVPAGAVCQLDSRGLTSIVKGEGCSAGGVQQVSGRASVMKLSAWNGRGHDLMAWHLGSRA